MAMLYRDHGINLNPTKIAGTEAKLSMWADKDGKLHPVLLVAGKGINLSDKSIAAEEHADEAGVLTTKSSPAGGDPGRAHMEKGYDSIEYNDADTYKAQ